MNAEAAEDKKEFWFPARRSGWGWGFPRVWQGWAVLALYAALLFVPVFVMSASWQLVLYFLWVFGITAALIKICRLKDEKPPSFK